MPRNPALDFIEAKDVLQTIDGEYVIVGKHTNPSAESLVLKIDSNGNLLWQKTYKGIHNNPYSMQTTTDGGYVVAGESGSNALVFKVDENGTIVWQKIFGGDGSDYVVGINQTADGGYTMIGSTNSFGVEDDIWVLKLNGLGDIIWQKQYGGDGGDWGVYFDKTNDGGYVIVGNTDSFDYRLMILKLDSNGEIPGCDIIGTNDINVFDGTLVAEDISLPMKSEPVTLIDTDAIVQDISAETSVICYYENPTDIDGDGVDNNPGEPLTGSMTTASFLADEDNCPEAPNGPYLGTCIAGSIEGTCIADEACGIGGICSLNQEDSYPPQGNGIGDACDCEGNFDCDDDQDGSDAVAFKVNFGRSVLSNPCESGNSCNGDFDCDGDCDGTDAAGFKFDFGRSSFNNPCPACVEGEWCIYP